MSDEGQYLTGALGKAVEGTKMMDVRVEPYVTLEEFYITVPELPVHTEVLEWADSNAPQRTAGGAWIDVALLLGGFLLVLAGLAFIIMGVLL